MKRRLSKRDLDFLLRLVEMGHVTVELLRLWFPELGVVAAGTWIKRLRKSGWLESAPLDQHTHYYRLSNKAVRYLKRTHGVKVSRAMTRPLKPTRKPEKHAFLHFVSDQSHPARKPFRPFRDAVRFAGLAAHVQSGHSDPLKQMFFYCEGANVGVFMFDRGGSRFLQKNVKSKVSGLVNGTTPKVVGESFKALVAAGLFRLTIVTVSAQRKAELEEEIRFSPPPFSYEIFVMEAIAALLPTQQLNSRRTTNQKGSRRGRKTSRGAPPGSSGPGANGPQIDLGSSFVE